MTQHVKYGPIDRKHRSWKIYQITEPIKTASAKESTFYSEKSILILGSQYRVFEVDILCVAFIVQDFFVKIKILPFVYMLYHSRAEPNNAD